MILLQTFQSVRRTKMLHLFFSSTDRSIRTQECCLTINHFHECENKLTVAILELELCPLSFIGLVLYSQVI